MTPQPYLSVLSKPLARPPVIPSGMKIIDLSINESPYGASPLAIEAAQKRIQYPHRYPDPSSRALRNAIAKTYQLSAARVVCGNGSEELLDVIGRLFARPGDEILISENGFFQFALVAERLGAKLVRAPEQNFVANVDALLAAANAKTKLLYLAVPNNPTGTILPFAEIQRLRENLPERLVLVLDCAYGEYLPSSMLSDIYTLANQHHNIIVTHTFSKAFGLAAFRVGWCYAPEEFAPALNRLRGVGNINAPGQAAAEAALKDLGFVSGAVRDNRKERQRVKQAFENMGYNCLNGEGNFLLTKTDLGPSEDANAFRTYLLSNAGILLRPVTEPGFENYARISLGTHEQNTILIEAANKFAAQALK